MSTEKKYYTPKIEDFYVGCDYEYKTHDGVVHTKEYMDSLPWQKSKAQSWIDITAYINRTLNGRMAIDSPEIETIRMKYLDREDIESLGWETSFYIPVWFEELSADMNIDGYEKRIDKDAWYDLVEIDTTQCVIQKRWYRNEVGQSCEQLFKGEIKSINELKKIMRYVGITETTDHE